MKKRVRAKFLPHEDCQLKALVAEYGEDQWRKVASRMPNRNVRQCRERWKHYICSDSAKAPWNPQEDEILHQMVNELGFKWTKIAKCLPGRTDIQVKARWFKVFQGDGNSTSSTFKPIRGIYGEENRKKNINAGENFNEVTLSESVESDISRFCDQIDFQFGEFKNTSGFDFFHI
ncbi:Myb-like DNA-binding domain containing protein [Histomonas meleagridis]|uniref:Myb-like DNA-binding domain containing protein n=1 Tax=Histomonas meleagridis TaxID=135588 RepID=UPI00355A8165|nr:Myb-like DNA-binding domain containing protein [Histomonas meleagridis]KAH0800659.1 Myb-like DNA-binding domain containing protein [Histomonas meleagridis]